MGWLGLAGRLELAGRYEVEVAGTVVEGWGFDVVWRGRIAGVGRSALGAGAVVLLGAWW